jgi:acetyl-CoA synthetase
MFYVPSSIHELDITFCCVYDLRKTLLAVREKIGPFATPEVIQHAPGLPKTRSGKIMRRILRKIAQNDRDIGDVSTLADEAIVEILFQNRIEVKA